MVPVVTVVCFTLHGAFHSWPPSLPPSLPPYLPPRPSPLPRVPVRSVSPYSQQGFMRPDQHQILRRLGAGRGEKRGRKGRREGGGEGGREGGRKGEA
jgi:hypothetical protein